MNPLRLFLRAKLLARHPPPIWKVRLFLAVIAACLLIAGIEYFVGWPDWLTVDRAPLKP